MKLLTAEQKRQTVKAYADLQDLQVKFWDKALEL